MQEKGPSLRNSVDFYPRKIDPADVLSVMSTPLKSLGEIRRSQPPTTLEEVTAQLRAMMMTGTPAESDKPKKSKRSKSGLLAKAN